MIHTKTQPGFYSSKDRWRVSWTGADGKRIVKEYSDVDNAYEDYCYYRKKGYKDISYDHYTIP